MATFSQWRERFPEMRRLMWICGEETMLIERVLSSELDIRSGAQIDRLDANSNSYVEIVDALNAYTSEFKRVVVIRNANKLKKMDDVLHWCDAVNVPTVSLILVSQEDSPDTMETRFRPFVERGRYVECKRIVDLVKFIRELVDVTPDVASYLVTVTGKSLPRILAELDKLVMFGKTVDEALIREIVIPHSSDYFVEELFFGTKERAITAASFVSIKDYPFVIGGIEYRLKQLAMLFPLRNKKLNARDLSLRAEVPIFLLKDLMPLLDGLDMNWILKRFVLLAKVDILSRQGNVTGVMERLVALW